MRHSPVAEGDQVDRRARCACRETVGLVREKPELRSSRRVLREELSQSESRKSPSGYQGHVCRCRRAGDGAVFRGAGWDGEARR